LHTGNRTQWRHFKWNWI